MGELVHEPDGGCRLAQLLDLLRALAFTIRTQSFGELISGGGELVQRQSVEAIDVAFEVRPRSGIHCFRLPLRHASIGTWPGCDATRSSHTPTAGYRSSSKPPSPAECVYA